MHTVRRSGKRSGFIQTLAARLFVVAFFVIPFYNFAKYSLEQLLCLRTIFLHEYYAQF
jgi:hypothetical protein